MHTNAKANTCLHVFAYSSVTREKTHKRPSEIRKKVRHSQGPLPLSSTRNICGLWNLNASYRCEMTALPQTAESIRAFWRGAYGTKTNVRSFCFSCCIYSLSKHPLYHVNHSFHVPREPTLFCPKLFEHITAGQKQPRAAHFHTKWERLWSQLFFRLSQWIHLPEMT